MQLHPLFYWRRKSSAVRRRYEQPGRHDFMIFCSKKWNGKSCRICAIIKTETLAGLQQHLACLAKM